MSHRGASHEIHRRLARKITVVEPRSVPGEKNLRSELTPEALARRIFSSAHGTKKFIRDASLRNVKENRVSWLAVVENKVARRARSVPLTVEVMTVDKKDSLRAKNQYSCEHTAQKPGAAQSHQPGRHQNKKRRQTEDHVASEKDGTG